jgi:hypothetical protein
MAERSIRDMTISMAPGVALHTAVALRFLDGKRGARSA